MHIQRNAAHHHSYLAGPTAPLRTSAQSCKTGSAALPKAACANAPYSKKFRAVCASGVALLCGAPAAALYGLPALAVALGVGAAMAMLSAFRLAHQKPSAVQKPSTSCDIRENVNAVMPSYVPMYLSQEISSRSSVSKAVGPKPPCPGPQAPANTRQIEKSGPETALCGKQSSRCDIVRRCRQRQNCMLPLFPGDIPGRRALERLSHQAPQASEKAYRPLLLGARAGSSGSAR